MTQPNWRLLQRRNVKSGDRIEVGDCQITLQSAMCCGVVLWWAILPNKETCCDTIAHKNPDIAIECAKKKIAQGIVYAIDE